jgi:hypothetical protein
MAQVEKHQYCPIHSLPSPQPEKKKKDDTWILITVE